MLCFAFLWLCFGVVRCVSLSFAIVVCVLCFAVKGVVVLLFCCCVVLYVLVVCVLFVFCCIVLGCFC